MCGESVKCGGIAVLPVEAVEQRGGGGVAQTNSTPVAGCSCGWVQ